MITLQNNEITFCAQQIYACAGSDFRESLFDNLFFLKNKKKTIHDIKMLSYLRFNFDRVLRPSIKKIYLDISVLIENITFPSMYFFCKVHRFNLNAPWRFSRFGKVYIIILLLPLLAKISQMDVSALQHHAKRRTS